MRPDHPRHVSCLFQKQEWLYRTTPDYNEFSLVQRVIVLKLIVPTGHISGKDCLPSLPLNKKKEKKSKFFISVLGSKRTSVKRTKQPDITSMVFPLLQKHTDICPVRQINVPGKYWIGHMSDECHGDNWYR